MSREISELTDGERAWLGRNEAQLRAFAKSLGASEDAWRPLDPPALDRTWAAWLAVHVRDQEDPSPILNAFGVALGQYLADRFNLAWKVVQDGDTNEFAIYGPLGDLLIFPPSLVAKRYAAGETGFFVRIEEETEDRIAAARLP
jgi:hypothetical protein